MEKYLRPNRFEADPESTTASKEWTHWLTTFTNFLDEVKCSDDKEKLKTMKQDSKKLKLHEKILTGSSTSNFQCILGDELTEEIPLVDVYVGLILNKKLIRDVILDLNRLVPVLKLQHLKRVNKNKIIICLCEDKKEEDVFSFLQQLGFNITLLSEQLEIHNVLKYGPKTRNQFLRGSNYWPTNFHEDKYLESLLANTVFSDQEMRFHEKWMRTALEAAKKSEFKSGTVIVDPVKNKILAVGSDDRREHPVKHSVMVAIDLISHSQGRGAWDVHLTDYFNDDCLNQTFANPDDMPYLCTGYYLYTTREPCIMCAMALIHSRIKRVFYSVSSSNGALGTLLKIHVLKNLNHHYEVFKGILKEEVKLLYL